MDASTLLNNTNDISNSIGTGGNYNEKVSPCADPVVHMSVSEALKQLKKLERDYQHTCESYLETRVRASLTPVAKKWVLNFFFFCKIKIFFLNMINCRWVHKQYKRKT